MEAKIDAKSEKGGKKACKKSMLKFDAGKSARVIFHLPFLIDFWSGLGGLGGG